MPDADDFDVEYFRNLLKGNSAKEGQAPPAEPDLAAKKQTRQAAKAAAAKGKGKPTAGRKPGRKR